jgi:hypothetical protein
LSASAVPAPMLIAAAHGDPTAFPVPLAIRLTVWSMRRGRVIRFVWCCFLCVRGKLRDASVRRDGFIGNAGRPEFGNRRYLIRTAACMVYGFVGGNRVQGGAGLWRLSACFSLVTEVGKCGVCRLCRNSQVVCCYCAEVSVLPRTPLTVRDLYLYGTHRLKFRMHEPCWAFRLIFL